MHDGHSHFNEGVFAYLDVGDVLRVGAVGQDGVAVAVVEGALHPDLVAWKEPEVRGPCGASRASENVCIQFNVWPSRCAFVSCTGVSA